MKIDLKKITVTWSLAFVSLVLSLTSDAQAGQIGIGGGPIRECFSLLPSQPEVLDTEGAETTEATEEEFCASGIRAHFQLNLELSSGWEIKKSGKGKGGFSWNFPTGGSSNSAVVVIIIAILLIGGIYYLAVHFISSRIDFGLTASYDTIPAKNLPDVWGIERADLNSTAVGLSSRFFPFNYDKFYLGGALLLVEEESYESKEGEVQLTRRNGYIRRFAVGIQPFGDSGFFIEGQAEAKSLVHSDEMLDIFKKDLGKGSSIPTERTTLGVIFGLGLGF